MDKHVYYSQNTKLAYRISQKYYNKTHYVWCCNKPFYSAEEGQPVSSNPIARCEAFLSEISTKDGHTHWISENKLSIKRGAEEQMRNKVITEEQRNQIIALVNYADNEAFYPVLYVIPYEKVLDLIKPADTSIKASESSNEFLIEKLPRDCFDIIDMSKVIPSVLKGVGEE